ncbi:MAG: GNAT family N-acetyltransferase [Deltaproteobacteria bacterium]
MSEVRIEAVKGPGDLAAALAIREVVFIEEQAVPQDIERDDQDETAFHVLAMQGGHAVGTGRLVAGQEPPTGERGKWGRVGRMAVLASHRKGGVGRLVLQALEAHARKLELAGIVLHAQVMSKGFYEREGYEPFGAVFEEAGMPHVKMSKRL